MKSQMQMIDLEQAPDKGAEQVERENKAWGIEGMFVRSLTSATSVFGSDRDMKAEAALDANLLYERMPKTINTMGRAMRFFLMQVPKALTKKACMDKGCTDEHAEADHSWRGRLGRVWERLTMAMVIWLMRLAFKLVYKTRNLQHFSTLMTGVMTDLFPRDQRVMALGTAFQAAYAAGKRIKEREGQDPKTPTVLLMHRHGVAVAGSIDWQADVIETTSKSAVVTRLRDIWQGAQAAHEEALDRKRLFDMLDAVLEGSPVDLPSEDEGIDLANMPVAGRA
jgi:hypothetical protein